MMLPTIPPSITVPSQSFAALTCSRSPINDDDYQTHHGSLAQQLAIKEIELEEMTQKVVQRGQQLQQMQKDLDMARSESRILKMKNGILQQQITQFQDVKDQYAAMEKWRLADDENDHRERLDAQSCVHIGPLREENQRLKEENENLQKLLTESASKINTFESKNSCLKRESHELSKEKDQVQEQRELFRVQSDELFRQLEEATSMLKERDCKIWEMTRISTQNQPRKSIPDPRGLVTPSHAETVYMDFAVDDDDGDMSVTVCFHGHFLCSL